MKARPGDFRFGRLGALRPERIFFPFQRTAVETSRAGIAAGQVHLGLTARALRVRLPMTENAPFVIGIVVPLAGNIQRNAADLGREDCQQENQGGKMFVARHGEFFVWLSTNRSPARRYRVTPHERPSSVSACRSDSSSKNCPIVIQDISRKIYPAALLAAEAFGPSASWRAVTRLS